jgi:hypothetical protein
MRCGFENTISPFVTAVVRCDARETE